MPSFIALDLISRIILNNNGEMEHLFLVTDFNGVVSSISILLLLFIMLRDYLTLPTSLKVKKKKPRNGCGILADAFQNQDLGDLFFLLMNCLILIHFLTPNNFYIANINPIWLPWLIFLMSFNPVCSGFLKNFLSTFKIEALLFLFAYMLFLTGFVIRVMMTS